MTAWHEFLTWIESSALGAALRDSGVWTYGIVNLFHILGIATLFGSVLALDLRLLGWRREIGLSQIVAITAPLAALGFAVAILSGLCMLATNGSEYIGNPFLPIKLVAIALALTNALILSRIPGWKKDTASPSKHNRTLATCGGLSLLLWLAAVASGRLIGYW